MPRYFIDLCSDGRLHRDDDGSELSGLAEAQRQAVRLLPDMARDVLSERAAPFAAGHWHVVSTVRDAAGRPLFQATLTISTERPCRLGRATRRSRIVAALQRIFRDTAVAMKRS